MIQSIGKVKKITPKDREYKFILYTFEQPTDLNTDECLEGQSIVFISERYEKEGEHRHNILYAACTNDLVRVGSLCDWTALNEKNANCIGILLIEDDMNEAVVISELLEDSHFSEIESIPTINSEKIHFLQGNEDYFEKVTAENKIQVVKDKIKEFFNMKNVNFLFGSGTSSPAIPVMKGLLKAIRESEMTEEELNLFEKIAKVKKDNIEEILGTLYSQKVYLEGVGDRDSEDLNLCLDLIDLIESVIYDKLTPKLDTDQINETSKDVLGNYKKLYSKITNRNKDLSRINVFTTNNDLFNETALDSLNIHYINGFSGGLKKYFNPAFFNYTYSKRMDTSLEKFEPVNNMVYLYKIHGSVNWVEDGSNANSYFNIRELAEIKEEYDGAAMIYPTPVKQNKSLGSPYVDLFREFQHKLLEPNSVLFVIGYSFSDEHINDIIYRSLVTNSSLILCIINNLDEAQPICNVKDNRIFRFWGQSEDRTTHYHYFNYFVDELVPDFELETRLQQQGVEQLVRIINDAKTEKNEDRKDCKRGVR